MYLFFLERYPHGIFAVGRAYVPTQEKKKKKKDKGQNNFLSTCYLVEIPSFWNTRYFARNTKFFEFKVWKT